MVSGGSDFISQAKEKGIKQVDYTQVAVSTGLGVAAGAYGGKGVQHKSGDVRKAKKVYDYAVRGIKEGKWSGRKGGHIYEFLDVAHTDNDSNSCEHLFFCR